jgi:hypothetical protein
MNVTRAVVALSIAMIVVAACRLPDNALDGPLAVPLRIDATAQAIEVDAPTWYADETAIYLCSAEPSPLPEPGPERVGWTPGLACHDFGRVASPNGLETTLMLSSLSNEELAPFADARDWFILLVEVEGDRAITAIHSSFPGPIRAAS